MTILNILIMHRKEKSDTFLDSMNILLKTKF